MHKCAGVHDAMTTTTNLKHKTSEQHIDLGTSRSSRDYDDLRKIQEWFKQYEPFNPNQPKLCSLSSGLTAADDDGVNYDQTEHVGAKIHQQLDRASVTDVSIRRSDQVRSLYHLHPGITVEKKKVHTQPNPTALKTGITAEEIGKAGVRLFIILFGGKQGDSLNFLRYVKLMEMISSNKAIDPQKLPPTERAAHFHSLRVHLQVMPLEEAHT